jgi:hypothetical protein
LHNNENCRYELARCAALLGREQRALRELRLAGEVDAVFLKKAATDPVFEGMRKLPAFQELVAEKKQPE